LFDFLNDYIDNSPSPYPKCLNRLSVFPFGLFIGLFDEFLFHAYA
jgi:hypothetical protein